MDSKLILILGILVSDFICLSNGYWVFPVQHKFKGEKRLLSAMKAHDANRHARSLSVIDLSLGGKVSESGIYWTKITIGTPPEDYFLQVDTGSSMIWLQCHDCKNCPKKAFGFNNNLYDAKKSTTSKILVCNHGKSICEARSEYGGGTIIFGYLVKDILTFGKFNEDKKIVPTNSSLKFGCSHQKTLKGHEASIGMLGLARQPYSLISQLAKSGQTKRIFSHCLDNNKGGGIFAIGELVEPKVNTTPLVLDNLDHYNVYLKGIDVGGQVLDNPMLKVGRGLETIIDSGTCFSRFPRDIYNQILAAVKAQQPAFDFDPELEAICMKQLPNQKVDDEFPTITFHFENSLPLIAYPRNYILDSEGYWFFTFVPTDDKPIIGDMVLSEKVVLYDNENNAVGWTDNYDCSSNIKVRDHVSGAVYSVAAQNLN